ncbi:MAG: L,D-transpeptidase family protein, partial [Akkermansiaceae bacterium]|nr:L,D-transpeptidase family protein [Akkermansiaceae bacterium]
MNDRLPSMLKACALIFALSGLTACDSLMLGRSGYMAGVGRPQHQPSDNGPHHSRSAIPDDISYWDGDGVSGSPTIRINRRKQKAFFYKGDVLVGVSMISSGQEDHATPPGRYSISQKNKDHRSTLYGVYKDKLT